MRSWWVMVLISVFAPCAEAARFSARLRWLRSSDPGVAGYHVYVRTLDGRYGRPANAQLPAPDPDGTLSFVMNRLDTATSYAFAIAAYRQDGAESGLSNEIMLYGPDVAPPSLTSPPTCSRNGQSCDAGDPCVPGVCLGGRCHPVGVAKPDHDLDLRRVVTKGGRLLAHGTFRPARAIDPNASGVRLEVVRDGAILYAATAPASAFRTNRRQTTFRLARSRRSEAAGLKRLVFTVRADEIKVAAMAEADALERAADGGRFTLVLRLGRACIRRLDLVCTPGPRVTSCD